MTRPRGFLETFLRIWSFSTIGFALLSVPVMGVSASEGIGLGLFFGTTFGLVMAPLMSAVTINLVPVQPVSADSLAHETDVFLAQLGYQLGVTHDGYRDYEPISGGSINVSKLSLNPQSGFHITVRSSPALITHVGPRINVRKLEQRLRTSFPVR